MDLDSRDLIIQVVLWTCAVVFIAIAVITLLALVGKLTLGGGGTRHDYFLKRLFHVLIVAVAVASVGAFADFMRSAQKQDNALVVSTKEEME